MMNKIFTFNSSCTTLNIKDAIDERFNKIKGVLNCLIFAIEFVDEENELDNNSLYHALWAIDEYLSELIVLYRNIENKIK